MFGRRHSARRAAFGDTGGDPQHAPQRAAGRRHGRRPIRSSLSGPGLADPNGRVLRFEAVARATVQFLQSALPDELRDVNVGFQTAPSGIGDTRFPMYYSIDRGSKSIVLFRMPIQRARVLHVDDAEHRRYFIEHCVYQAVCEYLGREPWEVLPGRFDHF